MIIDVVTTGAYLIPMRIMDNMGNETWRWVVSDFIDDTYKNGKVYDAKVVALSKEALGEYNN